MMLVGVAVAVREPERAGHVLSVDGERAGCRGEVGDAGAEDGVPVVGERDGQSGRVVAVEVGEVSDNGEGLVGAVRARVGHASAASSSRRTDRSQ